jgi:hypothetical protein
MAQPRDPCPTTQEGPGGQLKVLRERRFQRDQFNISTLAQVDHSYEQSKSI